MNEVTTTTYIAIDGREFTDYDECFMYELGMRQTGKVLRTLKILDHDKKPITRWETESKYALEDFGHAFYVSATSEMAVDYFNDICEECGYVYIPGTGTWFYDEKEDEWESVDNLMKLCTSIYDAFGK